MIDPEMRAGTPLADYPVSWACACGHRSLRHHEQCDRCGADQPEPPAVPEPTDLPITEALSSDARCTVPLDQAWR